MALVNVYDENGEVVARVKYNNNLDRWDGHNWSYGATGHHRGITKLRDGRFVLIHGTQWQGQSDTAEIISEQTAIQEILLSRHDELLKQFGLDEKSKKTLIQEA